MSAPTLAQFSAELRKKNIARQNLFYIEIIKPNLMISDTDNKLASMWCHAAQTPHMFISTNDNFVENGVRRKYAYDIDYQNLVLNFYIDQEFEIKRFFDVWKQLVTPYKRQFNFYEDYVAENLNLYMLNQEDNNVYKYTYKNVYPKTINSMELSFAGATNVLDLNVEFVFEDVYFESFTNKSNIFNTSQPKSFTPRRNVVSNKELKQTEVVNDYDFTPETYTPDGVKLINY